MFKNEFCFENYLNLPNYKLTNILCKFRCSTHKLLIESGRYNNIDRASRICKNCNMNVIEDEYHFLLVCPTYRDLRKIYLKPYFYTWPSIQKFKMLMSSKSLKMLRNISIFLKNAFSQRID